MRKPLLRERETDVKESHCRGGKPIIHNIRKDAQLVMGKMHIKTSKGSHSTANRLAQVLTSELEPITLVSRIVKADSA